MVTTQREWNLPVGAIKETLPICDLSGSVVSCFEGEQ